MTKPQVTTWGTSNRIQIAVIPANAGIRKLLIIIQLGKTWIPAFAGMTIQLNVP